MADAAQQTTIPATEAAAPVAAPAASAPPAAPPAEAAAKPAADAVDPAQIKALEKQAKALAKELEAAKAKAAEADTLREAVAASLGLAKKADPAEAITQLQEKLRQREAKVARSVLIESVRSSGVEFAAGVEPADVLALLGGTEDAVDVDAFALRDADGFKARLSELLERKPYLRAQAKPAATGLPVQAPAQPAPPTAKTAPPRAAPTYEGPGVFGRR